MNTQKFNSITNNVGDLNYKRRIKANLEYLDIKDSDKVLDCGCGDGFYTMILTQMYNCELYAMDYNYKLLKEATKRIKNKKHLKLIEGDITTGLPFDDNTFDKILFTEVLEHLDNEKQALDELKRVLKPGGKIAISVPNKNYPFLWDPLNWIREHLGFGHFNALKPLLGGVWSYDHKRLYSADYLENKILESELKVERMHGFTHYTLPFNLTLLYIGKQLYTSLPIPKSITSSMEKFEGAETKKRNSIIDWPFRFAKLIDGKNENINFIGKKSFITLFAGVTY